MKRSTIRDTLYAGQTLLPGQYLQSTSNQYYAILQTDGNFVIYLTYPFRTSNAVYATSTWTSRLQRPFSLTMQTDGNLVMYDQYGRAVWSSNTYAKGQAPHKLIMQSDANLVIYDNNWVPIWHTNTFNYHICH